MIGDRYRFGRRPLSTSPLAPTTMQSSVEQYGITWTFDQAYPVGQFVNGDYFVVGPVTITEIDPAFQDGRHGTMIDPIAGGQQAYDDRIPGSWFNAELLASPSFTVDGTSSVITAVSRIENTSLPNTQSIAVLTVVSEPPPTDAFRPPYVDGPKPIHRWSDVRLDLLPDIEPVSSVGSGEALSRAQGMQRPWILHIGGGVNHHVGHAEDNMPSWYHRSIGEYLARASFLLAMNVEDRELLLRNYLQVGIDYYYVFSQGNGSTSFWAWPVIFTGMMLGDSDIENLFIEERYQRDPRYLSHLYWATDTNLSISSSIVPAGKTWTGSDAAWRQDHNAAASNCYEQELFHPSEWSGVTSSQGCSQGLTTRETYRRINSPAYVGMAIVAAALGKQDKFFESDLLYEYAERWMTERLYDEPYDEHDAYGEAAGLPYEERGVYPYTSHGGEYGSAGSSYGNEFYNEYGFSKGE